MYSLDINITTTASPVPADQFLNVSDAGIQAAVRCNTSWELRIVFDLAPVQCNNGGQSDCGLAQSAIAVRTAALVHSGRLLTILHRAALPATTPASAPTRP